VTETIEPMAAQVDQQRLAEELVEQARAEGVELVGQGGLLTRLTKSVLETALEAEMTQHLGYDKHDPMGRNGGNSRNGTRTKTVVGTVRLAGLGVTGTVLPMIWLRGGPGQAVVDRLTTWFQVVNRMAISRRYSSAPSRWRWGLKCGDIPLNADRNRCAPPGEVNFFIARSRWRVG
jgi:Transposase, Mutator family